MADTAVAPDAIGTDRSEVALEVRNLRVEFAGRAGWSEAVSDVSFTLRRGETLGLVGESGCGKSTTGLAIMGLLPRVGSRITSGEVLLDGRDLLTLSEKEHRRHRGASISMIFQEPMTSLNPAFTIGDQIAESARFHLKLSRKEAWKRAVDYLELVEVPQAARRAHDYPHTFSGGMLQRAMIAMALVCDPKVLIADEPTTALDVTIQAQVLSLLGRLQQELDMAVLLVTHDLGVVSEVCDEGIVMYAGQAVERSNVRDLLSRPRHPYTAALLACMPGRVPGRQPLRVIAGSVPRPDDMPAGCRFAPRCAHAVDRCRAKMPALLERRPGYLDRCLRSEELDLVEEDLHGAS